MVLPQDEKVPTDLKLRLDALTLELNELVESYTAARCSGDAELAERLHNRANSLREMRHVLYAKAIESKLVISETS